LSERARVRRHCGPLPPVLNIAYECGTYEWYKGPHFTVRPSVCVGTCVEKSMARP